MEVILMTAIAIIAIAQSIRIILVKKQLSNVEECFKRACTQIHDLKTEPKLTGTLIIDKKGKAKVKFNS